MDFVTFCRCIGLKMHFNSVYLDELDNASDEERPLDKEQVLRFLQPYIELLGDRALP